jgi:hypothetical protein
MAQWVNKRRNRNHQTQEIERIENETGVKKPTVTSDLTWNDVKDFIDKNNRWPQSTKSAGREQEYQMAQWVNKRRNRNHQTQEIERIENETGVKKPVGKLDLTWNDVKDFIDQNRRWPQYTQSAGREKEFQMAQWVNREKLREQTERIEKETGVKKPGKLDLTWNDVKNFIDKNNRWPQQTKSAGREQEFQMAQWVNTHRNHTQEIERIEKETNVKRPVGTLDLTWNDVEDFIDQNNRWPQDTKFVDREQEKQMAQWVNRKKQREQTQEIERIENETRVKRPGKLDLTWNDVEDFIRENNRWPQITKSAGREQEKQMAKWVNRKKQIEQTQEIERIEKETNVKRPVRGTSFTILRRHPNRQ